MDKDEILKSLMDTLGLTQEEAESLLIKGEKVEKEPEKKEDEYSEDKEKELEKAMKDAEDMYKSYCSKKPAMKEPETKIEKSEEISKENFNFTPDMFKSMMEGINQNFNSKLSDIEKSLGSLDTFKQEIASIKEEVSKIGNYTPPAKSIGLTKEVIIEKAMEGGIQQDGKVYMGTKTHKNQIGDILSDMMIEEKNETIQKSIETDLMNFVGGFGSLSDNTKRLVAERKNIVII